MIIVSTNLCLSTNNEKIFWVEFSIYRDLELPHVLFLATLSVKLVTIDRSLYIQGAIGYRMDFYPSRVKLINLGVTAILSTDDLMWEYNISEMKHNHVKTLNNQIELFTSCR